MMFIYYHIHIISLFVWYGSIGILHEPLFGHPWSGSHIDDALVAGGLQVFSAEAGETNVFHMGLAINESDGGSARDEGFIVTIGMTDAFCV